ncbi:type VII secretion system-associated protein [Actinoplanes sp. N902-109]|uniref:type VII secretion system-associated protein n=1 Tax=Actinoplanes sp. (strain N902-109) TaxID=649831 RepID=UPI000329412A|nr:type VII secretion system-associated protein [Actinoplanes sp. N902-109]AGL14091.1 hypothetical protein L083_0581 [Actinoplanes sp. N902-109]
MTTPSEAPEESFFLLMDPEWQPVDDADTPPFEAVVGLWPLAGDGTVGRFRSNPEYRPVNENSPSDPVDALLRLALRGDAEMEQVQLILRDSLVDQAMNGDGRPLIGKSPDDVPCVILTTSMPHRLRVASPDWRRAGLEDVVAALPAGVDVLLNPGGPASVRLTGEFVRATAGMSDEELAAARAAFRPEGDVTLVPWEGTD